MKKLFLSQLYLVLLSFTTIPVLYSAGDAGEQGVQASKSLDPSYAPLEEGAGKYRAKVYDAGSMVDLCEISFFGHTKVGGVRKESDDSMNMLDLKFIKEIIIKKPDYTSQRYADKTFSLADVVADTGVKIEDMLLPKHIIICGKENNTHIEKSWFLNKVSRVTIEQPLDTANSSAAQDYVEKIFKNKDRTKPKTSRATERSRERDKERNKEKEEFEKSAPVNVEKGCGEEVAQVKKEVENVRQETAEIKRRAQETTGNIAAVKAEVTAEITAEMKKELARLTEEKQNDGSLVTEKTEQTGKEAVGPQAQNTATPLLKREQPAVSEHTSVKDAFVHVVRSIVDFAKSIGRFVMQLLPV